ncbi:MAG: nucleotide sugar dehydrogenase [Acidobacteria bacterium]|nr:nucleotide sugar dehydrogenase [Acidobacteriota bacterium]
MASKKKTKFSTNATLFKRLKDKTAEVGIIGMGYVGLPLALSFARAGFKVTGFDVDTQKVQKLQRRETYIRHIPSSEVAEAILQRDLRVTDDFRRLRDMDAILICVPTPLDEHREPDMSFVRSTAESIGAALRPDQLVVLESTTYPGTTEEIILGTLAKSGLRCPVAPYSVRGPKIDYDTDLQADFLMAFSPEREDPGNKNFKTYQVPKVIGGVNGPSARAAQILYAQVFDKIVPVSSTRAAEMTKLLENIYRAVNIALVNELKCLCLRMGIDIWEVIEAAKTKPFGFTPFYPGPGLGGHCIPIDPFYLTWKAREYDFPTRFIELAGEVNTGMPEFIVSAVAEAFNARKRCLQDSKILILGVAYKKDVDDLRESPSLRIMQLLQARGARVEYNDPFFPTLPKTRHYDFGLSSVALTPERLARYDAVLVATDHSAYDYRDIVRHSRLVIDTRNVTRNLTENREKIVLC